MSTPSTPIPTSQPKSKITLHPTLPADLPTLSKIGHLAFATDRHTLMKMSESHTDDFNSQMPSSMFDGYITNPRVRMIKAVDEATGEIVGFTNWGMWNFDGSKVPEPNTPEPLPFDAPIPFPRDPATSKLTHIQSLVSDHLSVMQSRLSPPGKKALYCLGISVLPAYQSQGVGTLLTKWACGIADENDASMWIHLADTEAGPRSFEKNGFEVVNTLRIDLDEWTESGDKCKWGVYTFRYMRRPSKTERRQGV